MSAENRFNHLKARTTTEAILIEILKTQGDVIVTTDDLENLLQGIGGSVETPGLLKPTDATGSPLQGMFSVSVTNTGAANGVLLGQPIAPGETLEYSAKTGNTLGDITFDATGTQFTILTTKIV